MKKTCEISNTSFEVAAEDLAFYQQLEVPVPRLCPKERMRRRLCFRNEYSLHKRHCDGTGRKIISLYQPETVFPVYDNDYWWSDSWDSLEFAREFDFTRTFSEQFKELFESVPKMARIQQGENENSQYTNCAGNNKNCFLLFSGGLNEDCLYCCNMDRSKSCIDCFYVYESELAYQSVDCSTSYDIQFCQQVHSSNTMRHCYDCRNCNNCIACAGLRGQSYCILNQKVSRETFEKVFEDPEAWGECLKRYESLLKTVPRLYADSVCCEGFSGAHLRNCKNSYYCWDSIGLEDCKFCSSMRGDIKNCYDLDYYGVSGTIERCYDCEAVGINVSRTLFSKLIWGGCSDVLYSYECFASSNIFGCCGLRHQEYSILNTKYSKSEYENLKERIIEHMKAIGEWGEFFPTSLSPFGYNETAAHLYFPLTREEALARGYSWYEKKEDNTKAVSVPEERADELGDWVLDAVFLCEQTGHAFKITKPELKYYQTYKLRLPKTCPEQRLIERAKFHGLRELFERRCDKTGELLLSPYAPESEYTVYSEQAYMHSIHGM